MCIFSLNVPTTCTCSQDSSVGTATAQRDGRSGDRIPEGARFSAPVQTGPGAYTTSCSMGTGSFPGVKRPGRTAYHPTPISAPRSWKGRAIPLLILGASVACYRENLYLYLLHALVICATLQAVHYDMFRHDNAIFREYITSLKSFMVKWKIHWLYQYKTYFFMFFAPCNVI